MAIAEGSAEARTTAIKKALTSPVSCSSTTVKSLEWLLHPPREPRSTDSTRNEKAISSKKAIATVKTTRTAKPTKSRTNTKVTAVEVLEEQEAVLTTQEKLKLATEVFNLSLKTLSAEIKASAKPAPVSALQHGKHRRSSATSRPSLSRTASLSQPLQILSPNRAPRSSASSISLKQSPTTCISLKRSSSSAISTLQGRTAIAECASLALSALRALKGQKVQDRGAEALELEYGVSALVGKLLLLGLLDVAIKELRAWRKRIDELLIGKGVKTREKSVTKGGAKEKGDAVNHRKSAIGDLIRFENLKADGNLLCLIITFQGHVLKLIAAERKIASLAGIADYLKPSNPDSPSALILRSLVCKAQPVDKVAQQLQGLAQTVWIMSSAPSPSGDSIENEEKMRLRLTNSFRLQVLSFELRVQWWRISGHRFNIDSDFWAPFSRCLTIFIHRASSAAESDYFVAKDGLSRMQVAEKSLETLKGSGSKAEASILKSMAQFARQTGNRSEALALLGQSVANSGSDESPTVLWTSNQCQIAALQLETPSNKSQSEALSCVHNATKGLQGDLRGSFTDLDGLLFEAARLNKLGVLCVSKKMKLHEDNTGTESDRKDLMSSLIEFVQSFPPFLLRYLGEPPDTTDEKSMNRYDQRMQSSKAIAESTIEGAIILARSSMIDDTLTWNIAESMLTSCITIADRLESINQQDIDTSADFSNSKYSPYVNLSNTYWVRYLHNRQSKCDLTEQWKPLRKAVTLLRGRSISDKVNGFAAVKLERLASTYSDLHRANEAKDAFEEAIRCYVEIGALQNIALRANTESFQFIWREEGDQPTAFRRLLASFIRFTHENGGKHFASHVYDDGTLLNEERGALLELQLMAILELAKTKGFPRSDSLGCLLRTLLEVYDGTVYPLRRLRVVLRVIRFSSSNESLVESAMISGLLASVFGDSNAISEYMKDAGLQRYATYLEGAKIFCIFFHGDRTQPEMLDKAISVWSTLLTSSDLSELESRTESVEEMAKQLEIAVDYFDMQGRWFSKLRALQVLSRLYELKSANDVSPLVTTLCRLGLRFSRLGYSGEAGKFLAKAQQYIEKFPASITAKLGWHLAHAEHLLDIGNADRCVEMLEAAGALHESNLKDMAQIRGQSSHEKQSIDQSISDASYVYSLAAFAKGDPVFALYHAKRCVMLNMRMWAAIEKRSRVEENTSDAESKDIGMDSVVDGISNLSIAPDQSSVSQSFLRSGRGSSFWSFIPRHYYGLSNLSTVSAHFGLFQDSIYYAEQAQRVAEAVNATAFIALNKSLRGAHWSRGGHHETAQELLKASMSTFGSLETTKFTVLNHSFWAEVCERIGDEVEAKKAVLKAQQVLSMISGTEFLSRHQLLSQKPVLEEAMASLRIDGDGPKQRTTSRKKCAPQKSLKHRPESKTGRTQVAASHAPTTLEIAPLNRLRGLLLRQKASSMIIARQISEAPSILAEAEGCKVNLGDHMESLLLLIRQLLLDVIKQLSSHAVYCVLSESTISFPSAKGSDNGKSRQSSFLSPRAAIFDPSSSTQSRRAVTSKARLARVRTPVQDDFPDLLNRIKEVLFELHTSAFNYCSPKAIHDLSFLHGRISLILHATRSEARSLTRPVPTAHYIDFGRSLAFYREHSSIRVETQLSDRRNIASWPENTISVDTDIQERASIDPGSFQAKYIDIIPSSWDVISISLSESRDELLLSKLQARQTPFFLRLPLKRPNAQDDDEVDFSFNHAKEELLEIIEMAHSTSHDARERTGKRDKAEWWTEREALDHRLEKFLESVECVWLGGFRGIFSRGDKPAELLSRFARSLQKILDKHLPSRQKQSKTKHPRTQLHSRVLELFVGLGEPKEDSDLEDCLTDLLYFVVDILQFQGEHNAYDEIDFDMIVVETLDALRCYHQELRGLAVEKTSNHTILILDKALHALPWESLPCLDGVSVSRLPSLGCLRDQILNQYRRSGTDCPQEFTIDKSSGTYILNPGGDLKNTQSTFSGRFNSLSTWTSITERAPTEDEFREGLVKSDLFLYFGHGSGAQYIRGRSIKRLDRCAAAFLMGCSSGKLTQAGDFESFGTPWNYMHAGCPALVATLWDVTDKDIDRFATGTFERWGLLEKEISQETKPRGRKQKSKAKPAASATEDRVMALDEAVAKARGDCVLRYLNGAAPVIYGIPLYLR